MNAEITDGHQYEGEPEAFEKKTLGDWTLFRLNPHQDSQQSNTATLSPK